MFHYLPKNTKAVEEFHIDESFLQNSLFVDDSLDLLQIEEDLAVENISLRAMVETFSELGKLHHAISTEGLSPSLLVFINDNNSLSLSIPEIPSFESYMATDPDERSSLDSVATEGVLGAMAKIVIAIKDKIKAVVGRMVTWVKLRWRSLAALRSEITRYQTMIEGKQFNEDLCKTKDAKIFTHAFLLELIEFASLIPTWGLKAMEIKLPHTKLEYDEWKKKMDSLAGSHFSHLNVHGGDEIILQQKVSATYADLGYDEHSFSEIVKKLNDYISEHMQNHDRYCKMYEDLETKTDDILDSLSTNIYAIQGQTITQHKVYSESGRILYMAFDHLGDQLFDWDKMSYKYGVISGVSVLGKLTSLYAHSNG